VRRLEGMGQLGFEFECSARVQSTEAVDDELFVQADANELFVGAQRLEAYLLDTGLGWVVRLAALFKEFDYSAFMRAYQPTGRRALHPRVMLGLVIYGILNRQWSLRELEGLARRDVGAWWICGGHQPDHSTIGKFIQLHSVILSEDFFVALVKRLMSKLHLSPGTVAGDGTVIEAAASRYRLLRAEAVMEAACTAQAAAEASPADNQLALKAAAAKRAASIAQERLRMRHRHGRAGGVQLSPTEPEAVMQLRKDRVPRPSYKPTVMVHEGGLIIGQHVAPSSERDALKPILEQHSAACGQLPVTVLLDAGFASFPILALMLESNIDVLCPSGRANGEDDWERRAGRGGRFPKQAFQYVEAHDIYKCPADRELVYEQWHVDSFRRRYRLYRGTRCGDCSLRERCTNSKYGRALVRYQGEELKEAMAQVLSQPAARAKYQRRQAIVEPCFAELRERQGLKRFHRRGLAAVRVEFALHCIAFNLKKVVHGGLLILITLWFRFPVRILALAFSVSHLGTRHLIPFPSSRITLSTVSILR
jgi:transposase